MSHERLNKVGASADLLLPYNSTRIYCGLTTSLGVWPRPSYQGGGPVSTLSTPSCIRPAYRGHFGTPYTVGRLSATQECLQTCRVAQCILHRETRDLAGRRITWLPACVRQQDQVRIWPISGVHS
jgi:hypothetical protein